MIIYYSSTGNSRHVATQLHRAFFGDLIDVCAVKEPALFQLEPGETLFLVTFNCFWGVSGRMEAFIRENEFRNVGKIVVILTCGGYLGGGDFLVEKLLREKGLPKPVVHALNMVTNYSILHDIPSVKQQKKRLLRAENTLQKIIQGTRRPYRSNWLIRRLTPYIHAAYERARVTAPFTVDSACVHCGLCERDCPAHAIVMKEGKPSWALPACENCLRCLHRCPVGAINYGDATRKRLRYTYEAASREGL